jgi:hypothetical protein
MGTEVNNELLINLVEAFGGAVAVPVSGTITIVPLTTGITTISSRQPVSTTNVTLKVANPNRTGCAIYNNSVTNLFVKFGATASIGAGTESFTRRIGPNEYYEVPFFYTGRIDAIWDGADATGEAVMLERFTGTLTPDLIAGLVDWHRADAANVTLVGSNVDTWLDSSGNGHTLQQTTDANRLAYVASGINGMPMLQGDSTGWMPYSAVWLSPTNGTTFGVFRYATDADYQIFLYALSHPSLYLGGSGAVDKPLIFIDANRAIWSSALTNGTDYLIKYGWEFGAATNIYTQVGAGTEVSQTIGTFAAMNMQSLSLDPGIVGDQQMLSACAEYFTYNRRLSPSEDAAIRTYINGRYAI